MMSKLKNIWLYLMYAAIIFILIFMKVDFHVDELLTYNLSNCDHALKFEDGIRYEPANQPFVENMASEGKIDFGRVWRQQTNDVHPPFYYALVHIMCLLHPGVISMRDAGMVNLVFQLLSLFFIRKIVDLLHPSDNKIKTIVSIFYILCAGVLNIAAFLRMYSMAMCMATIFTYLILKLLEKTSVKEYVAIYFATVIGALTHYYFVIYIFFVMATFSIMLLCNKRYKDFAIIAAVVGFFGGATSLLIFPAMIEHLLYRNRGVESIDNLTNATFISNFAGYFEVLNKNLFGGVLPFLLILIAIAVVYSFILWDREKKAKVEFGKLEKEQYLVLGVPIVLFILLVSKMAPYIADRYVSIIFGLLICLVLCLIYKYLGLVLIKQKSKIIVIGCIAAIITFSSAINSDWAILNLSARAQNNYLETYFRGADAICVYDEWWRINTAYMAASKCESSIFFKASDYDDFIGKAENSEIQYRDRIVFFLFMDDKDAFIEKFITKHPEYSVNDVFNWGYGAYCLTTEDF